MGADADLDSADWLCFFTETMIKKINPSIVARVRLIKNKDGIVIKRLIHVTNVSEEDILNLKFLANTNDNNNYLYLEYFRVELDDSNTHLEIPGLVDILLDFWRYSDSNAFEKDEKFFHPFSDIVNINHFVDNYTNLNTVLPKTYYKKKMYTFTINPDCATSFCTNPNTAGSVNDCGSCCEQCCCGFYCDGANQCASN